MLCYHHTLVCFGDLESAKVRNDLYIVYNTFLDLKSHNTLEQQKKCLMKQRVENSTKANVKRFDALFLKKI